MMEDPYGMYIVTEEHLKKNGGYVVERNGKLYTFYSEGGVMSDVADEYRIGYKLGNDKKYAIYLYLVDIYKIHDVPSGLSGIVATSAGDFPIFKISKNEEIRVYNKHTIENISVSPVSYYGYTINATHIDGTYRPIIDCDASVEKGAVGAKKPSVCDMSGNPVSDVYNLEYGKEYMYSWYKGTEYHEIKMVADSRCYAFNDPDVPVQVPINYTKNGYAVMDISKLPLGIYCLGNGIFEITN